MIFVFEVSGSELQGPNGHPSGRKSLGNALRTRGGITRGAPENGKSQELNEEEPVTHVETAPSLDRSTTEPLPAVQEEEQHSPLMTPKASERSQPLVGVEEEDEQEKEEDEQEKEEDEQAKEEVEQEKEEVEQENKEDVEENVDEDKGEDDLNTEPLPAFEDRMEEAEQLCPGWYQSMPTWKLQVPSTSEPLHPLFFWFLWT